MKKMQVIKFDKMRPEFYELQPAKSNIPKWYKDLSPYIENEGVFTRYGLKQCMPFFDSLTTGYHVPLPVDIYVHKNNEGGQQVSWKDGLADVVNYRDPKHPFPPMLPGFSEQRFVWVLPLTLELPSGYSALFTHPLNRFDLPFFTLSGIVDSYKMFSGNVPFILKSDFEGIIPAGTPIVQIIPFKLESWKRKESPGLKEEAAVIKQRIFNVISHYYKTNFWKRKTYE